MEADLIAGIGETAASGLIGAANASQQQGMSALGLLGSFLSDYRLKENVKLTGQDSEGRNLYSWDWIKGHEHITEGQPTTGWMAHEIIESDPRAVSFNAHGFMVINGGALHGH